VTQRVRTESADASLNACLLIHAPNLIVRPAVLRTCVLGSACLSRKSAKCADFPSEHFSIVYTGKLFDDLWQSNVSPELTRFLEKGLKEDLQNMRQHRVSTDPQRQ